jgi:hypothetical protein
LKSTVHEHLVHVLSMKHVVAGKILDHAFLTDAARFTYGCPHFSS